MTLRCRMGGRGVFDRRRSGCGRAGWHRCLLSGSGGLWNRGSWRCTLGRWRLLLCAQWLQHQNAQRQRAGQCVRAGYAARTGHGKYRQIRRRQIFRLGRPSGRVKVPVGHFVLTAASMLVCGRCLPSEHHVRNERHKHRHCRHEPASALHRGCVRDYRGRAVGWIFVEATGFRERRAELDLCCYAIFSTLAAPAKF